MAQMTCACCGNPIEKGDISAGKAKQHREGMKVRYYCIECIKRGLKVVPIE